MDRYMSDVEKMDYLDNNDVDIYKLCNIVKSFRSDDNKIKYINKFESTFLRLELIKSIRDDYKKVSLLLNEYKNCNNLWSLFDIDNIKNKDAILSQVKKIPLELLCAFICNSNDIELKKLLAGTIPYKGLKEAVSSNFIDNIDDINLIGDLDNNITIGVELESNNNLYRDYHLIRYMLGNWNIKSDASVVNGVEITSPKLTYTIDDLKKLKYVCEFMNNNEFTVDNTCGGHIHYGISCIESIEHLLLLLDIYCNCEEIFYLICNRKNSIPRDYVLEHAKSYTDLLYRNKKILYILNNTNLQGAYDLLYNIQNDNFDKKYSINFLNCFDEYKHTLEFRGPNGEIEYDELIYNILLFGKLLEKTKLMVNNNDYKMLNVLKNYNGYNRLLVLLDILFDDNNIKQVYKDRYNSNMELYNKSNLVLVKNKGIDIFKKY
ncbi:MAG: amidoligase family protein [Bacilli bacterium]|nr:amidoligase family protein [Bacilli bacterium]